MRKRCYGKYPNIYRKTPVLKSLFDKVSVLKASNFIEKRLQHMCFPLNIAKLLPRALFIEHLRWLVLYKSFLFLNPFMENT